MALVESKPALDYSGANPIDPAEVNAMPYASVKKNTEWVCKFCGKKVKARRSHGCTRLSFAIKQYRMWKDANKSEADKYPNYESFDCAVRDGTIVWMDYIGSPTISTQSEPEPPKDSGSQSPPADTGVLSYQPPGGDTGEPQGSVPGPALPDGIVQSERTGTVWTQDSAPPRAGVDTFVQNATAMALEAKVNLKSKFNVKTQAWMPIVLAAHQALMWLGNAKKRGTSFKLSHDQRHLLALSYQTSIGDSPLLKLRKKWGSEDSVDCVTANLEVYGEWIFENFDGIFEHGGELFTKLKNRGKPHGTTAVQPV